MMSQLGRRFSRAILGGFLIGSSLIGYAQDDAAPGVVRITDSRPRGVVAQPTGFHHNKVLRGEYREFSGMYAGDCPGTGYDCDCPQCRGGHGSGSCYYGQSHLGAMFHEHYGSLSADHGYSVPGKTPIYRRGIQYSSYYPSAWYGTPGGGIAAGQVYPTVYQPTDTTQLGYYYQHVPFWMPNPNVLPPRPIPSQWHQLVPTVHAPWHGNWSWGCPYCGGHGCRSCRHHHHGGYVGGACPANSDCWVESNTTAPSTTQPTPATTDPAPIPMQISPESDPSLSPIPESTPKNDSASNMPIRRASFQN